MRNNLTLYFLLKNTKAILLLLILTLPYFAFSQDYKNVNRELGLPNDLIFGEKVHPQGDSWVLWDGYFTEARIEHPIFNRLKFEYNRAGGLTSYTFYCDSTKKTEHNKEKILSIIEKYYGRGRQTGSNWNFVKDGEYVSFWANHDSCQVTVYTFNTIKAVKEYDQFEKERVIRTEGYTNNQFEDYVGNEKTGERRLFFKGIISAKTIRMYYTILPKTSKVLRVRLDDSISILLKPKKRYKKRYNASYMLFDLPREVAEKFYHCSKMTLVLIGKDSDEVEVPEQVLYMYRVVYKSLYNQN